LPTRAAAVPRIRATPSPPASSRARPAVVTTRPAVPSDRWVGCPGSRRRQDRRGQHPDSTRQGHPDQAAGGRRLTISWRLSTPPDCAGPPRPEPCQSRTEHGWRRAGYVGNPPALVSDRVQLSALQPLCTARPRGESAANQRRYRPEGRSPSQRSKLRRPLPKRLSALLASAAMRRERARSVPAGQRPCWWARQGLNL
jgi:hypothetical protein